MPLSPAKHVCSRELAEKLKDLRVKQDSTFYWQRFTSHGKKVWAISNTTNGHSVSAFTVSELGEMLPKGEYYETFFHSLEVQMTWVLPQSFKREIWRGDTEADARAKMLIYLIENDLLNPTQDLERL